MASSKFFSGVKAVLLLVVCLELVNHTIGDQIYCGSKLRHVIEMMCPHGVDSYKIKRGDLSFDDDNDFSNEDEDFFDFGLSLDMLPKLVEMENNGLAKLRRRRHGIVKECCEKPCSTREVAMVCKRI